MNSHVSLHEIKEKYRHHTENSLETQDKTHIFGPFEDKREIGVIRKKLQDILIGKFDKKRPRTVRPVTCREKSLSFTLF